jgi:hypothetical protein
MKAQQKGDRGQLSPRIARRKRSKENEESGERRGGEEKKTAKTQQ